MYVQILGTFQNILSYNAVAGGEGVLGGSELGVRQVFKHYQK